LWETKEKVKKKMVGKKKKVVQKSCGKKKLHSGGLNRRN
jgi:hypothetical protein